MFDIQEIDQYLHGTRRSVKLIELFLINAGIRNIPRREDFQWAGVDARWTLILGLHYAAIPKEDRKLYMLNLPVEWHVDPTMTSDTRGHHAISFGTRKHTSASSS